jgi:hypothetical protein
MWRCVGLVLTDVSEERIASIFRVEKSASEEPAWAGGCSATSKKTTFFKKLTVLCIFVYLWTLVLME